MSAVPEASPAVRALAAWAEALAAVPFTRAAITFEADVQWWRQTQRTLAGDEFHYDRAVARVTVPSGTVFAVAAANGCKLAWQRSRKGWDAQWQITISLDGDGALRPNVHEISPPCGDDPWVRPLDAANAPPLGWRTGAATTGRWWPLVATPDGQRAVAVLALAKADTHFRRVGCWRPRPALLAAMPPDQVPLLARRRGGDRTV